MSTIIIKDAVVKKITAPIRIEESSSAFFKENITMYLTRFIITPENPCPVFIAITYLKGRKLAIPYNPDSKTAFANP